MCVCGRARSKGFAAHEVAEIRAEAPIRDCSGDGVAIDLRSERHFGLLGIRKGWLGVPEPWRRETQYSIGVLSLSYFFLPTGKEPLVSL